MFDIFYIGPRPNVPCVARSVDTVEQAYALCRTQCFWLVTYLCDYSDWDWLWLPLPWQQQFRHAWASQWQPDSGTYLVPGRGYQDTVYHSDRTVRRNPQPQGWSIPPHIAPESVDLSWHPNPQEPDFVYHFPSQWQRCSGVTYQSPEASGIKIVRDQQVRAVATHGHWIIPHGVDVTSVDQTWHPDALASPAVYHFATRYQRASGVMYQQPGAQGLVFCDDFLVQHHVSTDAWHIPPHIDETTVDFSWRPDAMDPPYVYHFPSQWQTHSGVTYTVPGATEIKTDASFQVRSLASTALWHIPHNIDASTVDHTWHPDAMDPPLEYHFPSQWQQRSGVTYTVPGATQRKPVTAFAVRSTAQQQNWEIPAWIDASTIDFSWHPDPWDPPLRYHFATTAGWDHVGGPEYIMPGATETRYCDDIIAGTRGDPALWYVPDWIDPASIDATWCPCPTDPPYIYEVTVEWGWDHVGGPEYRVPGASERKYIRDFVARTRPDPENFEVLDDISPDDDLFRWRPNPRDPAYIYVFGNQWWPAERRASAIYRVPGATDTKYMSHLRAQRRGDAGQFQTLVTGAEFDWSWEPDPGDPAYIYVFGNQWWPAEIMPTVEYHVPGATERKYMDHPRARLPERHDNHWHTLIDCDWDYSWVPDPGDPPYIYVFGNQWHSAEIMPTVEYHVPGATQRKFVTEPRAELIPDPTHWHIPAEFSADAVDLTWCPDPGSPPYVYHFGSEHQRTTGITYTVPGAQEIKFAGPVPRRSDTVTLHSQSDIFYLDHSNALSRSRLEKLQQQWPAVQRVRVVNGLLATIQRCAARATTPNFWVISSHNDYDDFDFSWHPELWQRGMIHVFGTQWSKWSDTFLIHGWEFQRQVTWQTRMEDFYNLNFVEDQRVTAATDAADIIVIDHDNCHSQRTIQHLQQHSGRVVRIARYVDNYLDTLRRAVPADTAAQHVWICSTLCDYTDFDFSWQPEAWQRDMIHVFSSDGLRFGDTFLIPVQRWNSHSANLALLDWFDTINYVTDIDVPRWSMPVVIHGQDSHTEAIKSHEWREPAVVFSAGPITDQKLPVVNLWRAETKAVITLDRAAATVVVPREAAAAIRTQVYDYPHIDRSHEHDLPTALQSVMFISYDEPQAEENWQLLRQRCDRAQRIHGIQGIEAAKRAAAQASTTPWFYVVFAKTQLVDDFEFDFVPDYLQAAKHYIFHCRNAVNDLEYGHMGIVMYNRDMVLSADPDRDVGLDYTLSFPHEVVPVVSCVGTFNVTPYHTWRTAFREASKLAYFESQQPTIEGAWRLRQWLERAHGDHAQWCLQGAKDGVDFFQEIQGDIQQLRQCLDWQWLRGRFQSQHGDLE